MRGMPEAVGKSGGDLLVPRVAMAHAGDDAALRERLDERERAREFGRQGSFV